MFKISILVVAFLLIGNAKTWAKNLAPNLEDHQEVQEGLDEEESLHSFGDYNIHGEILEQVGVEGDNLEDLTNQQIEKLDGGNFIENEKRSRGNGNRANIPMDELRIMRRSLPVGELRIMKKNLNPLRIMRRASPSLETIRIMKKDNSPSWGTLRIMKKEQPTLNTLRIMKKDGAPMSLGTLRIMKKEHPNLGTLRIMKKRTPKWGTLRIMKKENPNLGALRIMKKSVSDISSDEEEEMMRMMPYVYNGNFHHLLNTNNAEFADEANDSFQR